MKFRIERCQGEAVPWLYGLAWRDLNRDTGVCYPIPLNRIFRVARELYFWIRFPEVDFIEKLCGAAKQKAYNDGYQGAMIYALTILDAQKIREKMNDEV